ncbi:MAG: HNH endonuclease, partial [Candidatus Eremiobacteraeota bacterium]|nr:HNH endonuclease [Candidatus Eremiobacteraeota bacterium]
EEFVTTDSARAGDSHEESSPRVLRAQTHVLEESGEPLQAKRSPARAAFDYLKALENIVPPIQNMNVCFNPCNRHATKAQKRELLRREGWCCATPGCPHKIWLHLHHLIPYSQGGPTLAHNLLGVCVACPC